VTEARRNAGIDAQRVDFIGVPVRDLARADEFYGKTLGLERNRNSSERWVEYETGNVTLALVPEAYIRGEFRTLPGASIALRVPNVEEAKRKLEEAGVEFGGELIDSGVCHLAFFTDPDGNGLVLHHRYAPYADGTEP
jgi:catechol 2,3-dioxygenase-like lactoylglutathione lyase family enzyme